MNAAATPASLTSTHERDPRDLVDPGCLPIGGLRCE